MGRELHGLNRKGRFWKSAAFVLLGALLGVLLAPLKNGVKVEKNVFGKAPPAKSK